MRLRRRRKEEDPQFTEAVRDLAEERLRRNRRAVDDMIHRVQELQEVANTLLTPAKERHA